jgi:hypothetical protein
MREVHLDRYICRYRHVATLALLVGIVGLGACHYDADQADGAFYNWDTSHKVHCAIDIDTFARNDLASVEAGLDRAVQTGEVLELYAHETGRTVEWDKVEAVLAAARARDLTFFTYAQLEHEAPAPGVLLSFDDASIEAWVDGIDLFAKYDAHATFFVAYYPNLNDEQIAGLHTLQAAGHAIEPHSIKHLRAPLYVEQKGVDAYMRDEALPSIDALQRAGFAVTTYAYPYGARTEEIDEALLSHVDLVRSVAFTWSGVSDPCPH